MTEAALSDLRVIEYAQGISGPFCAKALADLGADVVKIEPPQGDRSRTHDPFPNDEPHPERSGRFLYLNANKRGISLSLETDLGRAIFRELVVDVDLLICDLPPSRYPELEIDYERLHALNEGLVMVCISPFGLTGPYRDYKGSAFTGFHVGGVGRETPPNEITDPKTQPPLTDGGFQADLSDGLDRGHDGADRRVPARRLRQRSVGRCRHDGIGRGDDPAAGRVDRLWP